MLYPISCCMYSVCTLGHKGNKTHFFSSLFRAVIKSARKQMSKIGLRPFLACSLSPAFFTKKGQNNRIGSNSKVEGPLQPHLSAYSISVMDLDCGPKNYRLSVSNPELFAQFSNFRYLFKDRPRLVFV